jgi:amino acid transporter
MSEIVVYLTTVLLGIIAIIAAVLGLSTMRRSKELRKAKLFLKFDLADRVITMIGILSVAMVIFQLIYITFFELGRADNISLKMPYAVYAPILYAAIVVIFMTLFWIYKDIKKSGK